VRCGPSRAEHGCNRRSGKGIENGAALRPASWMSGCGMLGALAAQGWRKVAAKTYLMWTVLIRELYLTPELAGRRVSLGHHDGFHLELLLPGKRQLRREITQVSHGVRTQPRLIWEDVSRSGRPVRCGVFRMRANVSRELGWLASVPLGYSLTPDQFKQMEQVGTAAGRAAERVFHEITELMAIGYEAHTLTPVAQPEPHRAFIIVNGRRQDGVFKTSEAKGEASRDYAVLRPVDLPILLRRVRRGMSIPFGWSQYLEAYRRLVTDADSRAAVVGAVTAVEIGVKDALRRTARAAGTQLPKLEKERIRDLLTTVARDNFGQSYADVDKRNYDSIMDLVRCRNDFVHQGRLPPASRTFDQLTATRCLLEWLDLKAPW
jgi:hypothetical protein